MGSLLNYASACLQSAKEHMSCVVRPEVFPGIRRKELLKMGSIVYETRATAGRLILFVTNFHGGGRDFPVRIINDATYAKQFLDHQAATANLLEKLSDVFGDRMQLCIEGFPSSSETTPEDRELLLAFMEKGRELLQDAEPQKKFRQALYEALQDEDREQAHHRSGAIIHSLNGEWPHLKKRIELGQEWTCDYPSKAVLIEEQERTIRRYREIQEGMREADMEESTREAERDFHLRHTHIAQTFDEKIPAGGIGIAVLGGGHSRFLSRKNRDLEGYYAEDYLEKIPDAKIVTFQPPFYKNLLEGIR